MLFPFRFEQVVCIEFVCYQSYLNIQYEARTPIFSEIISAFALLKTKDGE